MSLPRHIFNCLMDMLDGLRSGRFGNRKSQG